MVKPGVRENTAAFRTSECAAVLIEPIATSGTTRAREVTKEQVAATDLIFAERHQAAKALGCPLHYLACVCALLFQQLCLLSSQPGATQALVHMAHHAWRRPA